MKKLLLSFFLIGILAFGIGLYIYARQPVKVRIPIDEKLSEITEKPLEKYTFENLRKTSFTPTPITLGEVLKEEEQFTSMMFYYTIPKEHLNAKEDKKVSGLINIPTEAGTYPVIVMYRGFVPKENFTTGEGTRRSAEMFAQNGFITLAPDFLGFGESHAPSVQSIEERFQTYPTAIQLLTSLQTLNDTLTATAEGEITADLSRVGIWGHSNGGHISLATLAITGKTYPTVLWNPVTKPFPYSILYFTDEFEDEGKALRQVVADFERDYDVFDYSPSRFYSWIQAPIQLHQGSADEAVPQRWSDQFHQQMNDMEKDITYYVYPGEDHNFLRGSWPQVLQRSTDFYKTHFTESKE